MRYSKSRYVFKNDACWTNCIFLWRRRLRLHQWTVQVPFHQQQSTPNFEVSRSRPKSLHTAGFKGCAESYESTFCGLVMASHLPFGETMDAPLRPHHLWREETAHQILLNDASLLNLDLVVCNACDLALEVDGSYALSAQHQRRS